MNRIMRMAAFRALSPDEGDGSGSASGGAASSVIDTSDPNAMFSDAAAEAAYKAANEGEEEEEETEGETKEEETVADAEPEAEEKPEETEAEPEDDTGLETKPTEGEIPADVLERYPTLKTYAEIESRIQDVATAPKTVIDLVNMVSEMHGLTPWQLLGIAPPVAEKTEPVIPVSEATGDWKLLGFGSKEEYDAAPDYERAGYDSPGELRVAQEAKKEIAELKAMLEPILKDRETQATDKARSDFEGAVRSVAPRAIEAVKAEFGWTPTEAQVIAAASRFPDVAATSVKEAVVMAHARDIAKAVKIQARGDKPAAPEMPNGQRQQGTKTVDPNESGYEAFADSVAAQY